MDNSVANPLLQKLYNLPIDRKVGLIPWFSLGALVIILGAGGTILRNNLQQQQLQQAEAQLAVTDIQYKIKIDQMGFGFRGQSDNTSIVEASEMAANGKAVSPELKQQIAKILQNEIKAREIEYATLVGKDKRILINANANRSGQIFDPNGLVSQVLQNPQQIKTSELVSWEELTLEKPPLAKQLKAEPKVLIRYTLTPVFDRTKKQVTGVLISGDIVDGKLAISEKTLQAFGEQPGYTAVYVRRSQNDFALATSMLKQTEGSQQFVPLSDTSILNLAVANPGKIVTQKSKISRENYALAAKAITDRAGDTVAIIVYGNLSNSAIFWNSFIVQLALTGLLLGAIAILTRILSQAIAQPIQDLQQIAQEFSQGNLEVRAKVHTTDEMGILASTFNILADAIAVKEEQLTDEVKRSGLLKEIALHIGNAIDLREVLQIAVEDSRMALETDRVLYYSFDLNWQGKVIAESVKEGFPVALGAEINDPCFADRYTEQYQKGRYQATANIYQAGLQDCHLQMLESFAVTANLVTPVMKGDKLVGLLIAHQCDRPRDWQEKDINLLLQIASQTGNALQRAELLEQQKLAEQQEREAKESLQRRALELLMEVDPVSRGDLTVRVKVQEDEIGTIADSYNATIENLRKLVSQVQQAAILVSTTTNDKNISIQQLSTGASEQTKEIAHALARINEIAKSIVAVADNAAAAEAAVRQAVATVKTGDEAMDRTVEGFQGIRETVAETAKKVKRLGESSQKISKVVNLIGSFADQTNLLALNASIEAAHAGEEGRGFAVVADEVRSLARQSAEATADIEALVKEIQAETNEVVAAMESGTEQVVAGTKLVDATRQSLLQITDASHQIDRLVEAIAKATVQQSQDSQIVSQTMTQVAAISDKTAIEASQVSASFEELLTVAQQLQDSVAKFKVN
jgi:methyl-accepting chemotaxis protein